MARRVVRVGTVVLEQAWRYPVKSMGGEQVDASWADAGGLLGDRVWAVQDSDGKLGSGKNTRRFRRMDGLLELSARYPAGTGPVAGTATLDRLAAQLPDVRIDVRRFRPNLVVRTAEPFAEETWVGRPVRIGAGRDAVHAVFDRVIERCVMVGMHQPGLPAAGGVLKSIAQRADNPLRLAIGGHITRPGMLRIGAPVLVSQMQARSSLRTTGADRN